jgi:hypothetical protein
MSSAEHVLYHTKIFLVELCIFLEFRPRVGVNASKTPLQKELI